MILSKDDGRSKPLPYGKTIFLSTLALRLLEIF
jgi:hypothetical protein